MSNYNNANDSIKKFPSENDILVQLIDKSVDGTLDSGGRFYGTLEGFSEFQLFIRGARGQLIVIKRRKVSRLEAV